MPFCIRQYSGKAARREVRPSFFHRRFRKCMTSGSVRRVPLSGNLLPFSPQGQKGPLQEAVEAKCRGASQFLINELLGEDAPVVPLFTGGKAERKINVN
jgi:hypothetical protein